MASFSSFCIAARGKASDGRPIKTILRDRMGDMDSHTDIVVGGADVCSMGRRFAVLADGVGVKPASRQFAQRIVYNMNRELSKRLSDPERPRAHTMVQRAYDKVLQELPPPMDDDFGASTLSMVVFSDRHAMAAACNLGDSGTLVLRKRDKGRGCSSYETVLRTAPGQSEWNTPHQMNGIGYCPLDAHLTIQAVQVREGDLVIVGSDGLFDNLDENTIVRTAAECHACETLAHMLVIKARDVAATPGASTPYSRAYAVAKGMKEVPFGKPDDVSVCVGRVTLCA